jgi:hypothetical protein
MCWRRFEKATSCSTLVVMLFLTFIFIQYSFYSVYVDSIAEHTSTHQQAEGRVGAFLRSSPRWGGEERGPPKDRRDKDEGEYLSLSLLQQPDSFRLGLVVRAHAE